MIDPPPSLTQRRLAALILILIVAAFVRFYQLGTPSLWSDELWSIEMAMGHGSVHDTIPDGIIRYDQPILTSLSSAAPWWEIWSHVQVITHPPLYYILLRVWMNVFGSTPLAVRSLSVLFSLVAVVLFFDVCRLLHGPRTALLAAGIMALAIGQIDIAQESRSYSLLIFEEIAACNVIARIALFGAQPLRLMLLGLLLAAMFLTHYLCIGILIGLAAFAIFYLRGRNRRDTLIAFACAGLFVLAVWGHGFANQLPTIPLSDPTYFHEIFPHHILNSLRGIARLPIQYLVGEDLGQRLPIWAHLLASAIVAALVVHAFRRRDLSLWAILFIATIASIAATDLMRNSTLLQYSRYTIAASPALYAIIAGFDWPRKRFFFPIAAVTSLAILVLMQVYRPISARQDFHKLAGIIDSNASPDELLVFYNQSDWLSPGMWYMGYKYYSPNSEHLWLTLRHPPDAKLLRQIQTRPSLWLIGRNPEIYGPILFPGWQPTHLWRTTAGGICLLHNPASDSVP